MSATKRAFPVEPWLGKTAAEPRDAASKSQVALAPVNFAAAVQPVITKSPRPPALRVVPLLRSSLTRQFVRVPTHAVGVHPEQRQYPRAKLKLPLRLSAVSGVPEEHPITLVMRNISSTGVYFLCPKYLGIGTRIMLEVVLVSKPMGLGSVIMTTMAHVCRTEAAAMPGWYGMAACFDDVQFDHDDDLPSRFLKP
ncbi:MAG TPA: PilZ domain-containing protein [Candidatus Acidoferrum sp.]|nr:PilZ domain-containing protein [Candidatus Acidoferrum sp.]